MFKKKKSQKSNQNLINNVKANMNQTWKLFVISVLHKMLILKYIKS